MKSAAVLVLGCTIAGLPAPLMAQTFPARLVRFVVPVAAGGNLDNVTRAVAQRVGDQLGRQVLVENRAGSSSIVGADYVLRRRRRRATPICRLPRPSRRCLRSCAAPATTRSRTSPA